MRLYWTKIISGTLICEWNVREPACIITRSVLEPTGENGCFLFRLLKNVANCQWRSTNRFHRNHMTCTWTGQIPYNNDLTFFSWIQPFNNGSWNACSGMVDSCATHKGLKIKTMIINMFREKKYNKPFFDFIRNLRPILSLFPVETKGWGVPGYAGVKNGAVRDFRDWGSTIAQLPWGMYRENVIQYQARIQHGNEGKSPGTCRFPDKLPDEKQEHLRLTCPGQIPGTLWEVPLSEDHGKPGILLESEPGIIA